MSGLNIIGIDLAKTNFDLFSLSPEGKSTGRIKLPRDKLIEWFATQPRMVVAMEACGASLGRRNPKDGPQRFDATGSTRQSLSASPEK